MNIDVTTDNVDFFQALSSETRLKIINILEKEEMNIKDLAEKVDTSSTVMARHINKLEEVGIITTRNISAKRGLQKVCKLNIEDVKLRFHPKSENAGKVKQISIPVGTYSAHKVHPTCGLAGKNSLIGDYDDPRHFNHHEHHFANLLWFAEGWIEYQLPCFIFDCKSIKSIKLSLEICSEYPLYNNDFKSDIYFYFNSIELCKWISPGNLGGRRGRYNPPWWIMGSEYGVKIDILTNKNGTYINNQKISKTNITDINFIDRQNPVLKIACPGPDETENSGGINIFGKGFGDYDQDIEFEVEYN
jgi:predicted transcriptional regulator